MLIKNYGLFWRLDEVDWGAGSRRGHLRGVWKGGKREGWTDFREQRGIYVLYDANFNMIYAGQAGSGIGYLFDRLKYHTRNHLADRWTRFSWFGTRDVRFDKHSQLYVLDEDREFQPTLNEVLNQIEGVLIAAAEPKLNRQGPRWGDGTYQYLQVRRDPAPAEDE